MGFVPLFNIPVEGTAHSAGSAAVRAARAFLYEMAQESWGTVEHGTPLTEPQIALFRLANMYAVASRARVVDMVTRAPQRRGGLPPLRIAAWPRRSWRRPCGPKPRSQSHSRCRQ
jgi:hypothetical protein